MPGLEPGIQNPVFGIWMAGPSPAMTRTLYGSHFPGIGISGSHTPLTLDEATISGSEVFFIDPMHFVNGRSRKLDSPPHPKIVLQNPAEFDLLDRR